MSMEKHCFVDKMQTVTNSVRVYSVTLEFYATFQCGNLTFILHFRPYLLYNYLGFGYMWAVPERANLTIL